MKNSTLISMIRTTAISVLISGFSCSSLAQTSNTAAVFGIYVNEVDVTAEMAANVLRIELNKIGRYQMLDKLDLLEVEQTAKVKFIDCYGKQCLESVGKKADVDYAISGAVESLGPKMVITLKIYNVRTGSYAITTSMEFYKNVEEIQRMMRILVRKAHDLENEREMVEMLTFYEQPPTTQRSRLKNDGPRFGLAYVGGEMGDVIQLSESKGGYDAFPLMSQFGYQLEKAYISSGDFEALVEGLFLATGIEQNLFIPSLTILNGFRSTSSGWEFGFGPSISVRKTASGYYDSENNWHAESTPDPNIFEPTRRIDSRGTAEISATWVWAIGKTFRSGYLNIPVNAFFSHGKYGWNSGISMGFNISR